MALTMDSKLKDLVENPETAAILEKHIPGITTNKNIKMGYGMTLRAICKFPKLNMPLDKMDDLEKDLAALDL